MNCQSGNSPWSRRSIILERAREFDGALQNGLDNSNGEGDAASGTGSSFGIAQGIMSITATDSNILRESLPRIGSRKRESLCDRVEQDPLVNRFEQRCDRVRVLDEALCRKVVSAGDQYGRQAAP
jgi:hypothetical protein